MDFNQLQVLRTDASGMPLEWLGYQEVAKLYHLGAIAYVCGAPIFSLHGGVNAKTGRPSIIEVNSIIATYNQHQRSQSYSPPLSNQALFRRDNNLCLYCGMNVWSNVVTACKRCNNHKAGRTPEQANMQLLAIPFTPTHAEYVYLQGKRVLSDQMEFLKAHFPRKSPLHGRIS